MLNKDESVLNKKETTGNIRRVPSEHKSRCTVRHNFKRRQNISCSSFRFI